MQTTITFGSILKMNIRNVKADPSDYSLSIPSGILPGLNELEIGVECINIF